MHNKYDQILPNKNKKGELYMVFFTHVIGSYIHQRFDYNIKADNPRGLFYGHQDAIIVISREGLWNRQT